MFYILLYSEGPLQIEELADAIVETKKQLKQAFVKTTSKKKVPLTNNRETRGKKMVAAAVSVATTASIDATAATEVVPDSNTRTRGGMHRNTYYDNNQSTKRNVFEESDDDMVGWNDE
jgi:hypothetical protein